MLKYKDVILYMVFIVLIFAYSLFRLKPEIVKAFDTEKSIREKSAQTIDLETKLATLKKTEADKMDLSGVTKKIYKPDSASVDAESSSAVILDDIIDMTKYNGIKMYAIEYVYNPLDDEFIIGDATKYNVCQLNMSIIADYLDLQSFLKELYKYPYLVSISKLEMSPYPKNKKILMSNLQIKLYSSK